MDKKKIIIAAIILFIAVDIAAYFFIQAALDKLEKEEAQTTETTK